jgi:hypothetical protein
MPSIRLLDSALACYSWAKSQIVGWAAMTDAVQLEGAVGTLTKVRYVEIGGTANAARTQTVALIKRSTATSGTTNTTPTIAKADSGDAAPQSVLRLWSSLPSVGLGTAIGTPSTKSFNLTTTGLGQDRAVFANGREITFKPITLGGGGLKEYLCVNFSGVTTIITTDLFDIEIWWTEQ